MIRVMISHRHGSAKTVAASWNETLCILRFCVALSGPIQNSLSHFSPLPPTTQRLRNSSLYLRLAPISYELLLFNFLQKTVALPEWN